jgi:hypothetical protein
LLRRVWPPSPGGQGRKMTLLTQRRLGPRDRQLQSFRFALSDTRLSGRTHRRAPHKTPGLPVSLCNQDLFEAVVTWKTSLATTQPATSDYPRRERRQLLQCLLLVQRTCLFVRRTCLSLPSVLDCPHMRLAAQNSVFPGPRHPAAFLTRGGPSAEDPGAIFSCPGDHPDPS